MKDSQSNTGRLDVALLRQVANAPSTPVPTASQPAQRERPHPHVTHGLEPSAEREATTERRSPQRTCVGCRHVDSRQALQRLVASSRDPAAAVRLDDRAVLPGRGVWLHPQSACVSLALRRRALQRGLQLAPSADLTEVERWCAQLEARAAHR
ncbi:YlxR family protein [Micrococcales bacterium 31B]|nr:YlxR family protein [Micrococcales bacterium 31B]